ncbi:hypothetical protein DN752_11365 [Echinicola strongylocentroti]|uniref:Glycine-rich domain-containing protein n=1 Tax=Echinicola strongylocentroti TaxID=1795355 RepID=A0A2Z4IIY2_9BACT|nr:hypothetical protein [Echinicola strongylocentroti]AWW30677.1 hypothetical protein DN752_11365 [Echinicola strongylocentroti]
MSILNDRLKCSIFYFNLLIALTGWLIFTTSEAVGQCSNTITVPSGESEINIELELTEVITYNTYCPGGFEYRVRIDYNVSFTGPTPTLWTLQGYLICDDGTERDENYFDLPEGGGSGSVLAAQSDWHTCYSSPPHPSPADLGCFNFRLVIQGPDIQAEDNEITEGVCEEPNSCVEEVQVSELERLYIYRCDGPFTVPAEFDDAEVLLVAGGGGGGYGGSAGGGGAGGMVYEPSVSLNQGETYPVYVGKGGEGATSSNEAGQNGMSSYFNNVTAIGGGGGGSYHSNSTHNTGRSGGSGGGHASNSSSGASSGSQGNEGAQGGQGNGQARSGGGGGGAETRGISGNGSRGGDGGEGASSPILEDLDVSVSIDNIFAGGGGGSGRPGQGNNQGTGGSGIGGDADTDVGGSGEQNTGSGGGAGWDGGGDGADGMVIIRLRLSSLPVLWKAVNVAYQSINNTVQIDWQVKEESSTSHYVLERSLGGIDDFKQIATLESRDLGEELIEYRYQDHGLPALGGRLYYRIREVDIYGDRSYSEVYSVTVPTSQKPQKVWKIYPNPSSGADMNVSYSGSTDKIEKIYFRLVSPLHTTEYIRVDGQKAFEDALREIFSSLKKGIWVLEIRWEEKVEYIKLVRG